MSTICRKITDPSGSILEVKKIEVLGCAASMYRIMFFLKKSNM